MKPQAGPNCVEVHIEELVLHGFPAAGRQDLAEALGRELQRRFSGNALPPAWESGLEIESINAGEFVTSVRAPSSQTGADLARTLWDGFNAFTPGRRGGTS